MGRKRKQKPVNLKGGFWVAGFLLLGVLMTFAVKDLANRNLKDVVIMIKPTDDGSLLIDKEDVLIEIERAFGHRLARRAIKSINFNDLEAVLEKSPFIAEAEVFIDAKNKIHLEIAQRNPMMRVLPEEGEGFYLDVEGSKIPLTAQASPRVMVVTGAIPVYQDGFLKRKEDPLKDLFGLMKSVHQDPLLRPLIEQVHLATDGDITLVPKMGRQKIIFGHLDNVLDKLERLKIFYTEGLPVEGWQKYKTINLTFDGQVVCGKA